MAAALQVFVCESPGPDLVPAIRARLRGIGIEAHVEILLREDAAMYFIRVHTADGQEIDFP